MGRVWRGDGGGELGLWARDLADDAGVGIRVRPGSVVGKAGGGCGVGAGGGGASGLRAGIDLVPQARLQGCIMGRTGSGRRARRKRTGGEGPGPGEPTVSAGRDGGAAVCVRVGGGGDAAAGDRVGARSIWTRRRGWSRGSWRGDRVSRCRGRGRGGTRFWRGVGFGADGRGRCSCRMMYPRRSGRWCNRWPGVSDGLVGEGVALGERRPAVGECGAIVGFRPVWGRDVGHSRTAMDHPRARRPNAATGPIVRIFTGRRAVGSD